ncbi:MAG: helix-turn-helix domain-containing protein [Mogibacterium sp.]|nr:helix-turn-helix domain-containing protein [Mogibacterium sp.]
MKFSEIVEILGKRSDICIISSSSDPQITSVKLWDGISEDSDESTLYFSYDRQPASLPENCILASKPEDCSVCSTSGNLACISPEHFAVLFNSIQAMLNDINRDSFYHYLMDVADNVRSVEALIDVASQSFNASLVLIDRDFRILGYSTQVPVIDALWEENIRKGYCDYEFISEVRKLKSVQMADSSTTPFEVTCKQSPYRKLASRVYCKDAWIGSLLLIEGSDTYRAEHVDMLRILSGVTGYTLLTYSPDLLYRTSEYQSFLYNLLIGMPPESLPEAYRNLKFQENMNLLFFKASNDEAPFTSGSALREAFHKELPDCHVITHRKAVTAVCSSDEISAAGQLLKLFPAAYEVRVGISSTFHKIDLLREAMREAKDALEVGTVISPDDLIFPFEKYSVDILLQHLSEKESISRYYDQAVPCLIEYDEANGTRLLETLRTYLETSSSIKDTAEALYLHRNSVIYRIRKIEELCGIDLDDPEVRFRLRLSFHIMQLTGKN